ncbi:uncharacterized protein YggE [Caulobacter ginsengisoli]|uniref:Uncharacterized protein YggE n=1 Tax=Caulobacter ginsengisoli TaxID=400775 RepID=A0ABU0IX39_9CAUL|nr:SIMPL domain-containing protein [Caulobacter ginsengisoli]MDQ0465916.1 uncharacterized protein YggE [Caulobacter ginsengisoli]
MTRLFVAALAALSLSTAPALAQSLPTDPPSIVIVASGRAEAPAEFAGLSFKIHGEAASKVEALKTVTAIRERIEAALPALAGSDEVAISANDLTFYEVRPPNCQSESDYSDAPKTSGGPCRVTSYIAELAMDAQVWPAQRLGDAASLLAQLGADDVEPGGGQVQDLDALRASATKAALDNARKQAERIAASAGGRLGRILRIQVPSTMGDSPIAVSAFDQATLMRAPPPAVRPIVSVDLKVAPVSVSTSYVVVYELLK